MSARKFIILAAPRTGSNLLCTLLNSHAEICCHHEIFNPRGIFYSLDHRDGSYQLGTMEQRDRQPLVFLQRLWEKSKDVDCIGFKMTRGQNETIMRRMINDANVFKILLARKNRLKTFVSEMIANQTDKWEIYAEDQLATDKPILQIDIDVFKEHCALNKRFYENIQQTLQTQLQPFIELIYEELFTRSEHTRLLEFLGVTGVQDRLRPASIRQNHSKLRTIISNFQELEAALVDSEYHTELYE